MTEDELREIEARCEAATPGPWEAHWFDSVSDGMVVLVSRVSDGLHICAHEEGPVTNADFIAHARGDMPALLAEVRRLHAIERRGISIVEYDRVHEKLAAIDSEVHQLRANYDRAKQMVAVLTSERDRAQAEAVYWKDRAERRSKRIERLNETLALISNTLGEGRADTAAALLRDWAIEEGEHP